MLVIEAPVLATRTTKKHGITTGLRAQYESAGPPFRASLRIVASQEAFYGNELELEGLQRWPELNGRSYAKLPDRIRSGINRRSIS